MRPVLFFCSLASSVARVTLLVDMGLASQPSDELFVGGGSLAAALGIQAPGLAMTKVGDSVWQLVIDDLVIGQAYTYKFRNGNSPSWDYGAIWEVVPAECRFGQYNDRQLTVAGGNQIVGPVCFSSCVNLFLM